MEQVLEFFALLNADAKEGEEIVWKLVSAQTNSPEITVEGEAASLYASVDVSIPARTQKSAFVRAFKSMIEGRVPKEWRNSPKAKLAREFIERNMNGVGYTEIVVSPGEPPITLDRNIARQSVERLKIAPVHQFHAHEEMGSLEGVLLQIGTHHNKPALSVRDRLSRNLVTCIITESMREEIDKQVHAEHVWKHREVIVRGTLLYNNRGEIYQAIADSISLIDRPKHISLDDIYDPDFTGGLGAAEYLERLREGDL